MRGIGPRQPLPIVPAATPDLVDHFRCVACGEWVYATDDWPCPQKARLNAAGYSLHCVHHMPTAKIRCDHCVSR